MSPASSEPEAAKPPAPSLRTPPQRPRVGWTLAAHVTFTFLYALLFSNTIWLMPLLVRLEFGSSTPHWRDWQTTLVTAAVPTLMMTSIFWAELLTRVSIRVYLTLFGLTAALPLGLMGAAHGYGQFLACHALACVGIAAWTPINGRLLRQLYPDALRGRAYGVLSAVALVGGILAAIGLGAWMERDAGAFRWFLPVAAAAQAPALMLLARLAGGPGAAPVGSAAAPTGSLWQAFVRPVREMSEVLRSDRVFARYEVAFMTYGGAYMFCEALLPVLATDRLGMRYQEFAYSTQVVARIATLAAMLPMGWLQDRIGAVRISGLAFGCLGFYPFVLLAAGGPWGVGTASLVWGIGMAGVQMGWMLGPVSLARSPDRVPQYVAIHATLVGIRGVLFQGAGMLTYQITGSFALPLAIAGIAFASAAWQMWRLDRDTRAASRAAPEWP